MSHLKAVVFALFGVASCASTPSGPNEHPVEPPSELRVMAWNIWHGGREDGETVGPQRVVEVIAKSGADLVAMQETYGSGEVISEALGFHFHPRGTNVSIHSRYPVREDISVHEEFNCVGALVDLPDGAQVAFYSIWLPYSSEIWAEGTRDTSDPDSMLAACAASTPCLEAIWGAIQERLADAKYQGVPIIIAGDLNSMSHIDYGEVGRDQYGAVIDWPTSHVLADAGFTDTYRACTPVIDRSRDWTWSPRFPDQERDRIDFIYARGGGMTANTSEVIREHATKFPSDHAALVTTFERATPDNAAAPLPLRAVSYNIKHGRGMDGVVDLARTAGVLREVDADFIALQEVDLGGRRSGSVNQVNELAASLGMHPAFGSFMPHDGGHYGMAILSRHPIVDVESIRLPDGNEPRVALLARVRHPNGREVSVASVHFDWVADDEFRFAQAQALTEALASCPDPVIVLGDFNDVPGSRTIEHFVERFKEAGKPERQASTFPSGQPRKEIDFVFVGPAEAWRVRAARVIDEKVASDHRPVAAELTLTGR